MKHAFLHHLASHLLKTHQDVESHHIILPGNRAADTFRHILAEKMGNKGFLPEITTIDDWVNSLHPYRKTDPVEEQLAMFSAISGVDSDVRFQDFITWAQQLQDDFNDVLLSMHSAEQVFLNLANVKELENWDLDSWSYSHNIQEGERQTAFKTFWNKLSGYFQAYIDYCNSNSCASRAMQYHQIAKHPERYIHFSDTKFHFAGFGMQSEAEHRIISWLSKSDRAFIYRDSDPFYMSAEHEGGNALRRSIAALGTGVRLEEGSSWTDIAREINLVGVQGYFLQCSAAAEILRALPVNALSDTLLVPADESLVPQLLHLLPRLNLPYNVTMGFPMKATSEGSVIQLFSKILETSLQRSDRILYYTGDLAAFFAHPAIKPIFDKESQFYLQTNSYLPDNILQKKLPQEFHFMLCKPQTGTEYCKVMLQFIEEMRKYNESAGYYLLQQALIEIQLVLQRYPHADFVAYAATIFRKRISSLQLAIQGDAGSGVQVMGMLECRLLNYNNIIILSVNEGVLPGKPRQTGFIPYDLRRYFGLPVRAEQESLYAYNFYRLLQCSTKVWLVYNSAVTDNLNIGEESRYIKQLQHDLKSKGNTKFILHQKVRKIPVMTSQTWQVDKDENVMNQLQILSKSGLSASALSAYINCPLNFYHRYVLGLEQEKPEGEITDDRFGNLVHKTLEGLYNPFIGKEIESKHLEQMVSLAPEMMVSAFRQLLNIENPSKGKTLIHYEMALKFVERALWLDRKELQQNGNYQLIGNENKISYQHNFVLTSGSEYSILLKGTVDRVDKRNGVVRLVDYKTGKVNPEDLKINNRQLMFTSMDKQKQLQLMLYEFIVLKSEMCSKVCSAIFPLKAIKHGVLLLQDGDKIVFEEKDMPNFVENLDSLLQEIFNPEIPFVKNQFAKWDGYV